MKRVKILFQEPFIPREVTYGKFTAGIGNNTFPCGMASVAAYIHERGYEVAYLEPSIEGMTRDAYLRFLGEHDFGVIGMSATTLQVSYCIRTCQLIKSRFPHIATVLGGVHATLLPEETLDTSDAVDYLVMGDGERPFLRLIDCLSRGDREAIPSIGGIACRVDGRVVANAPSDATRLSEQELPIPLYSIFPMRKYVARISYTKVYPTYTILASRGCPFKCSFCNATATMGRRLRFKPVERVLEEITLLRDEYGAKGLIFLDSTFTANHTWLRQFCQAYAESGLALPWACNARVDTVNEDILRLMKDAGCWTMLMGIESANQKSLDLMNKGTTVEQNEAVIRLALRLGFYVYTSYILGVPGEDERDVLNTIKFARRMGNHLATFYLPTPFPKTKLMESAIADGGLRADATYDDYNCWDASNPVYVNPLLGADKMQRLLRRAFMAFYLNPVVWYRNAKEIVLLRQSFYKWWLGLKMFLAVLRM